MNSNKVNYLIIAGGMIPLQSMAIFFWVDVIGNNIESHMIIAWISGIVLSIAIEVASLWFWYHKDTLLASLASMVVIGSALYHVAGGSMDELKSAYEDNKKVEQLDAITDALKNANSQGDWYKTTQVAINGIVELNKKPKAETEKAEKVKTVEEAWFKIIVQAIALIILQIAQIKASVRSRESEVTITQKENTEHEKVTVVKEQRTIRNAVLNSENSVFAKELLQLIEKKRSELGYLTRNKFIVTVIVDGKPLNKNVPTKLGYVIDGDMSAYSLSKMKLVKEAIEAL